MLLSQSVRSLGPKPNGACLAPGGRAQDVGELDPEGLELPLAAAFGFSLVSILEVAA